MIILHMDEMKENVVFSTEANAEYVHLIEDVSVWFIDYIIGVAFRTPINFADKMNGLRESGRPYREFTDYKDMQDYLDEITAQEIVIESSIDPGTDTEFDSRITWKTKLK
jgi:hypothetical protein